MPGTLLLPPCMGTYTSYSYTIPQTDTKMHTCTFTCTAHIRGGRLYEAYSFFCKLDMLVYLFIYLFICVTRLLEICFIDKTRRPKRTKQGLCSKKDNEELVTFIGHINKICTFGDEYFPYLNLP